MSWIDEKLTEQFYRWELRGRGWQVFEEPVSLEPPFRPFEGYFLPRVQAADDGRKATVLSSLVDRLWRSLGGSSESVAAQDRALPNETESDGEDEEEPWPEPFE